MFFMTNFVKPSFGKGQANTFTGRLAQELIASQVIGGSALVQA